MGHLRKDKLFVKVVTENTNHKHQHHAFRSVSDCYGPARQHEQTVHVSPRAAVCDEALFSTALGKPITITATWFTTN